MLIPVVRAPLPPAATRRYRTREERIAIVEELTAQQKRNEAVSRRERLAVAAQHGISERTVRRALAEAQAPAPGRRSWKAPRELFVRTAMHGGNIKLAYEEMWEEQQRGQADWGLLSYQTAHRAIHADPGLQISLAKGIEAFQRFLLVGEYEPTRRDEIHYIDAMHVPIRCMDRWGRAIEDLWFLSDFEAHARIVVSHACMIGEATGQITADVFVAGALGRPVLAADFLGRDLEPVAGAYLGGSAETLIVDNALANKSDLLREATTLVGTKLHFGRPHIAVDKAKQERFHDTLQDRLAALPGYLRGAEPHPADGHHSRPYAVPADRDLLRVEVVIEAINAAVEDYNWRHVVSTTGSTPMARYLSETTLQRRVDPIILWPRMAELGTYRVHPRGVKIDGAYRTATHSDFVPGTDVEVRWLPGVPGRTFFGQGGRYRGEVKPHAELSEDDLIARVRSNAIRGKRARSVAREAGQRLLDEATPEDASAATVSEPVSKPTPRRRQEGVEIVPNRAAAIGREWHDPTLEGAA